MPYSFGSINQTSQNGSTTTSNKSIIYDDIKDSPDLIRGPYDVQAPTNSGLLIHRANSETFNQTKIAKERLGVVRAEIKIKRDLKCDDKKATSPIK